jgi:pentatricopeptide repeat protein
MMQVHAKMGDAKGARSWIDAMTERGMRPDSFAFNIWLSAVAQAGDTEQVEAIVGEIEENGIEADEVTYSTAIGAFAEAGDPEGAKGWLMRAESAGVRPNLGCYNQVMKACKKAGNWQMADHLMRRLLRNTLVPDMYTYNMLLGSFVQDGNPKLAEFWLDHMQRRSRWRYKDFPAKEMARAHSDVLLTYARSGNLEAAEAWHSQMIGEGSEPRKECYTALVEGHLREGRPKEARKWAERMVSWTSLLPPQDLVQELKKQGEFLEAVEVAALPG